MGFDLIQVSLGQLADICAQEDLKHAVVVADDGCTESLRWSRGLDFLMETVQIQTIVSLDQLIASICQVDDQTPSLQQVLDPWSSGEQRKLVILTSRHPNDLKPILGTLLTSKPSTIKQLVVGFALPEKSFGETFTFESMRNTLLKGLPHQNDFLRLIHVPLLYSTLFNANPGSHPNAFVLTHPQCASVFPLMRSQLKKSEETTWTHVQEVAPQDIPEATRRGFKCLSHALGSILMHWQLEVKERIFALGATSLKIGHTLQHFINQLQEEYTMTELKEFTHATLILVDRTCDLATPSSHQYTLLDRILQLLPPSSSVANSSADSGHITEVSPLFSPTFPAPNSNLSVSPKHETSSFLSSVKWGGGVSICHPQSGSANNVLQSLALKPPIAALKHLDKELRDIAMDLIKQKLTPMPEKKDQPRGRDVILRWIKCLTDCTDTKITWQHEELLQIGIAVLESLERMESSDSAWKHLVGIEKNIAAQTDNPEWIIPSLVEWLFSQKDTQVDIEMVFQLCIYAFAQAGECAIEPQTKKTLYDALKSTLIQNGPNPLLPPSIKLIQSTTSQAQAQDDEWDDWEEDQEPVSNVTTAWVVSPESLGAFEDCIVLVVEALQECGQLYKQMPVYDDTNGLLPRLLKLAIDPSHPAIPKLTHVTDASEQLTRAGMDLLKSGLSVFGFSAHEAEKPVTVSAHVEPRGTLVLFVVGGITIHEFQAISEVLKTRPDLQVIVGSTSITSPQKIQKHVWPN